MVPPMVQRIHDVGFKAWQEVFMLAISNHQLGSCFLLNKAHLLYGR